MKKPATLAPTRAQSALTPNPNSLDSSLSLLSLSRSLRLCPLKMADSPRKKYSRSPSPWRAQSRSRSRSRSWSRPRSRSRSWSRPPRQRSRSRSRGRSRSRSPGRSAAINPGNTLYVTGLSTRVSEKDVERHFSKEGKSRRKRPRTPTPGHYLGLKNTRDHGYRGDRGRDRERERDHSRYRGGSGRDDYGYRRSPRRSPYRGGRDYSPRGGSPYGGRSRRERSYSPYCSPERKYARGSR